MFYPWDLEVDLHKPKVWDGKAPYPLLVQQPTQGLDLQGKLLTKLRTYTRNLST